LGCGAHLVSLRRTEFGSFSIVQALDVSLLATARDEKTLPLVSLETALLHYREIAVMPRDVTMLRQGRQEVLREIAPGKSEGEIAKLVDTKGELVAMVQFDGEWKFLRVFSTLQ
jgi:tRNA U55 pseudouridine synthase TruB